MAIYRRFCGARRRRGTGATPPRHLYQAPVGAPQVGKFHESEVTVQRTSEHFKNCPCKQFLVVFVHQNELLLFLTFSDDGFVEQETLEIIQLFYFSRCYLCRGNPRPIVNTVAVGPLSRPRSAVNPPRAQKTRSQRKAVCDRKHRWWFFLCEKRRLQHHLQSWRQRGLA